MNLARCPHIWHCHHNVQQSPAAHFDLSYRLGIFSASRGCLQISFFPWLAPWFCTVHLSFTLPIPIYSSTRIERRVLAGRYPNDTGAFFIKEKI
jgi:hypothetical protein